MPSEIQMLSVMSEDVEARLMVIKIELKHFYNLLNQARSIRLQQVRVDSKIFAVEKPGS